MSDAIAALAKRFWSVHPNEIHPSITREQFYEREMRALFTTQAARIEALEAALATCRELREYDKVALEQYRKDAARIEQLEARFDRAVTRGLEQVERIATLEAALRAIADPDNCLMIPEIEEIASAALAASTSTNGRSESMQPKDTYQQE
jgi:hypothetical protein